MYLMWRLLFSRQLFFLQRSPKTPKGWTPLQLAAMPGLPLPSKRAVMKQREYGVCVPHAQDTSQCVSVYDHQVLVPGPQSAPLTAQQTRTARRLQLLTELAGPAVSQGADGVGNHVLEGRAGNDMSLGRPFRVLLKERACRGQRTHTLGCDLELHCTVIGGPELA